MIGISVMKELTILNNKFAESQNQNRRKKIISHVRVILISHSYISIQYLWVSLMVGKATLANSHKVI